MNGQIVVITGSSRGFGFAVAEAMLKAGATVVISARTVSRLKKAAQRLSSMGSVAAVVCDVRRERQVYALARRVVRQFGRIDVWINNAGYSASAGMMMDMPPEPVIDMFLANDMGTLHGSRAALYFMLPEKRGTLVNIYGAGSFLRPASPTGLYGATKAWITSFTRSLAKELKGSGVRVIGFSPGMLLTEMLTAPTVVGKRGQAMMDRYGLVLRMLADRPERAAEGLVNAVRSARREFTEYRLFKPWKPLLGLLRVAWENLTHTAKTPTYKLTFKPAYKPKI
jgi:NAD(P)-dependent dehydrogenase (short-subunit alcohol dehydrogenase family)